MIKICLSVALLIGAYARNEHLVFEDEFTELDFTKWQHEITLGGGGNWEF